MQLGNPAKLDAERNALRDAFDAVWLRETEPGPKAARACRCAMALDAPTYEHGRGNWIILPSGARFTGATNAVLRA